MPEPVRIVPVEIDPTRRYAVVLSVGPTFSKDEAERIREATQAAFDQWAAGPQRVGVFACALPYGALLRIVPVADEPAAQEIVLLGGRTETITGPESAE